MIRGKIVAHLSFATVVAGALLVSSVATLGILATVAPTSDPAMSVDPAMTERPAASTRPNPTDEPQPVFAEECIGPELDQRWTDLYAIGDPGHGLDSDFSGGLRRISVANGLCTITAERARTPSGRMYAAAAMGTRNAFAQAYGTFEARLRYSAGQGVWPAFWLLPAGALRPPPEIDIFEAYPGAGGARGGSGVNVVVSALHYEGGTHYFSHDAASDLTSDFHTHRLVWSPDLLVFSIDGVETGRITRDVPTVPMYPILNLALGAPGFRADATTPAIATMEIDYVRIWAS